MIKTLGFLVIGLMAFTNYNEINLEEIRVNYSKLYADKQLCTKTILELDKVKTKSSIYLGYLGGIQTINAKHVSNPFNKLRTFNKGKKNIEKAITLDPKNLELRFIRLSVQKNAPTFLNYYSNIEEDSQLLTKNWNIITSGILKKNIEETLKK